MNKYVLLILIMMPFFYASQNTALSENPFCQQTESFELKILSWNIYMLPYISLFNDNNLAYNANGERKIIDYVLVRNGDLIKKIERKVQTFFTYIGGCESNLSDHYAMEFCVNFAEPEDNTNGQLASAL